MAGTNPQQHNVVVIIDQPRCNGAPAQIDGLGARTGARVAVAAYRGESAVLDDDLGYHRVLPIQGHDLAVGEVQIAGSITPGGLCVN